MRTLGARISHCCRPGESWSRLPQQPCPSSLDTCASSERYPSASSPGSSHPVLFQQTGSCKPALQGQGDRDRRTRAASPGQSRTLLVQNLALTTVSIKRFQGSGEKPQDTALLGVSSCPQGAQSFQGLQRACGFPLHLALSLFNVVWSASQRQVSRLVPNLGTVQPGAPREQFPQPGGPDKAAAASPGRSKSCTTAAKCRPEQRLLGSTLIRKL